MCIASERLKAEGIELGMEKGIEKTVVSMLKKNYPISEIYLLKQLERVTATQMVM